jgi:hypothetical protein
MEREYAEGVRPILKRYCLGCHSTEKHKGDLDLERFASLADVIRSPKAWQGVVEQLESDEMPPKDEPQPLAVQRETLLNWVTAALTAAAEARTGDPGPVVLRRLNNAEYTYTIRDLTGVASLDPAMAFPADSAAGEGFMNVGNSLVMSPGLVTKYLDAAKDIAAHAVLLPDGIAFSVSASHRDWAEERLAAIREFYGRFTIPGGGSSVNLQGIKFDTMDGGVLPLAEYLQATLELRALGVSSVLRSSGEVSVRDTATEERFTHQGLIRGIADERHLNARYLATLWTHLNAETPSLLLNPLRAQWRSATPEDAPALAMGIARWQQALWRFTQVGHIGKRDGPTAWQVPVTPLAESREVRFPLPQPEDQDEVILYLATSDAGDGNEHDFAVWQNPRLVAPGRPDLPLRDVRAAVESLRAHRGVIFQSAANCLAAAQQVTGTPGKDAIAELAKQHHVEAVALSAWLNCLGVGAGEVLIEDHLTSTIESAEGYDFIKGWTGVDALSVVANSSDSAVRIPGNMKPRSVAVHPSPNRRVVVGWRSPVETTLRAEGVVQHAHPECGNGIVWTLELRRGRSRQRLATGLAHGSRESNLGPIENLAVQPGDVLSLAISPRDGNHACDLTAVDLSLSDGTREWDMAKDISPDILASNPHGDRHGHPGVWHFYSQPDDDRGEPALPAGSLLAKWQSTANAKEKEKLAEAVQGLLANGAHDLEKDAPDAELYRQLTSLNGPLLSFILRDSEGEFRNAVPGDRSQELTRGATVWGLDPGLFGHHPNGTSVDAHSLCVHAPSIIEVRLPGEFTDGAEFVATATLHQETGHEGSVQTQVLTTPPASLGLTPMVLKEEGSKSTWSDGERPERAESPILVNTGSTTRKRIETALDEFRQLFPAALCYTRIVPVDEVVTLTLYYREDDHLRRLMLDEEQAAQLERLWSELHYVSHDAFKLVDAYEQLWQYATQDADPSAFEPLRQPIKQRAEEFRQLLAATQPAHVDAVLKFAEHAYRRPLSRREDKELRDLYQNLRAEEFSHEHAVRLTLARTLVAPAFLYRIEQPVAGDQPGPVSDWEMASRLSYFLWSSSPDAELRAAAAAGRLRQPDVLAAHARRMLRDPRVRRFAIEFACAWLHIYDFDELDEKSDRHFPTFTRLRGAMFEETIRFFTDLFQTDESVLNILDADYTFLNTDLARHYDIDLATHNAETVREMDGWFRVQGVKQFGRGGILAQATTLAKQSGASRTSPILRGNWLTEVLLGEKLPRPPKDVPPLPDDEAAESVSVRELTERHSSDPKCYGCHRRIDPYGYSLEAYDAIGRLRTEDTAGRPINAKTMVMDGSEIDGLEGLRQYLLTTRRDAFLKQFCRKLLGYSLGREVMLSDLPLINVMRAQLTDHDYRIGAAMEAIVRSRQFREIRGREVAREE